MKIATIKAQAKNLRLALAKQGVDLTACAALEAVASQYGFPTWDALCGVLKKEERQARSPIPADLPGIPDAVRVFVDGKEKLFSVETWDEELVELLHDESALRAFVDRHQEVYLGGLDSSVLFAFGDGEDVCVSAAELLGVKYVEEDGRGLWQLADGKTRLEFVFETGWKAPSPSGLSVPELVKSAHGCSLIALRSHDGSAWDHFAMVPPHLDAAEVASELGQVLTALKERDAQGQGVEGYEEFTDIDVRAQVERLGCTWVDKPVELGQNWDC
ncbi:hypothetical protein D3C71_25410 [compost metagenome]